MRGVVLNGGAGRRLGGRDKACLPIDEDVLLGCVFRRLMGQCDYIALNAPEGRRYTGWPGLEIFQDDAPGYLGPAAGLMTTLNRWPSEAVLTVAVDLPLLPRALLPPLQAQLALTPDACCSYAVVGNQHALVVLWRPHSSRRLAAAYRCHGPRVGVLLQELGVPVAFVPHGDEDLGLNVNTWTDHARAQAILRPRCAWAPWMDTSGESTEATASKAAASACSAAAERN